MAHTQLVDPREALDARGYAIVEDVIDPEAVLDPFIACLARRLSAQARSLGEPAVSSDPADLARQLIRLVGTGATWPAQLLDISLPQGGIGSDTPMLLEPEAFALLSDPALLDLVERVIGPTIWLSPVGHTRFKVPMDIALRRGHSGDAPWHQDNGVLLADADGIDILTVWIPLLDVTLETGCLQVLPTPRAAPLLQHCAKTGGLTIPEAIVPTAEPVALPMRRGSVLLMHSRTLHASTPNLSADEVRLSMDLRYQSVGSPTGRPQFPSFILRDAPGSARAVATFADWRDGWLATRETTAARSLPAFNRWDSAGPACA